MIGRALREIRDEKLYRAHYRTFEEYCEEWLGCTRMNAHYYIAASSVAENVKTFLQNPSPESIPNFGQAIQIARLGPEKQREVVAR